ncbi:MAG: alpha/beta fold hydrolase [Flavobacteriaceae bacterium]|nr:alpha/beta fold hydrolase [Flavobacteriaceae bacterium]
MEKLRYINIDDYLTENGNRSAIRLSYQTFGRNRDEAPIVLVNHALTGNSNVCGPDGWWKDLIGEGKCIDTNTFAILAFDIPGNGYDGITKNLIDNYQDFNTRDIAKIFALGLEQLKISSLFAVIGGSVGGGIAWELAVLKPDLIEHVIPIATDWKSTDWLIANCYIQDNILNNSNKPLSDARIHAMTLYRTPESLAKKFGRSKKDMQLFNVESWLHHHGKVLNKRFQLAAYKMMNQVLRTIDITHNRSDFLEVASAIKSHIYMITINSDLFFKAEENWNTYVDLKSIKDNVTIGEIKSIHGHDGFLIEYEQLSKLLEPVFQLQTDKLNITA